MDDTHVENEAGWGLPINQSIGPIHWWTPFNNRACDPEFMDMQFIGDRTINPRDKNNVFCFDCLIEVLEAAKILGTPETISRNMMVQTFGKS